jgi:hypothetical protein
MQDCSRRQQQCTVTVQIQEKFLAVSPEKRQHAQNNRQDYRQGHEDNQPETYLLPELALCTDRFGCGFSVKEFLQPWPITFIKYTVVRPHQGQYRQTPRENRCKGGVYHQQIAAKVSTLNQDRIKTGNYKDYETKQRQKIDQFSQDTDEIQLLLQENQCDKMN